MNSILYVGMDVHKENYTLCCYSFDRDKVEYRQTVPSDYRLILKYLWSRCAGNIRKKWNSSADMRPDASVIRSVISSPTTASNASSSRRPPWAYNRVANAGKLLYGGSALTPEKIFCDLIFALDKRSLHNSKHIRCPYTPEK